MTEKQAIFTLMGGRVKIRRGRYNPTSDAVWLAAMGADIHAKTVLDVGIGTGGVSLCLMAHNPDFAITGIDTSAEMLTECAQNAQLNNRDLELINTDITTWRTNKTFDLVITNPPYFQGTPATHNAHHNADLDTWFRKCVARVRPNGYICTIVDASALAKTVSILNIHCGDIYILPLFGSHHTAERVLIRARLASRAGTTLHRGISMNTEAILRDGLTIGTLLSKLDA